MWTEPPTPDALLAARIAAGWRPLPSPLAAGPAILGHAATRFAPDGSPRG